MLCCRALNDAQGDLDESKQRSGKQVSMTHYFNVLKPEMECSDQKVSGWQKFNYIDFYNLTKLG